MNTTIASASANEVRATLCRPLTDTDKANIYTMLYAAAARSAYGDIDGQVYEVEYANYTIAAAHRYETEPTELTTFRGDTLRENRETRNDFDILEVFDTVEEESRPDIMLFLNRKF